jgi:hypothetical protein
VSCEGSDEVSKPFGEDPTRATVAVAEEAADLQAEADAEAADGEIGNATRVTAMDPAGGVATAGAACFRLLGGQSQRKEVVVRGNGHDLQALEVREERQRGHGKLLNAARRQ